MANIFVSYSREDRSRVEPFVRLLTAQGWTVWWDRELVPGHTYEDVIDQEIQKAECVLVFWSKHSIQSEWVLAEAHDGFDRRILIPILLDDVRVPLAFRRKQAAALFDWPEVFDDSEVERIFAAIGDLLGQPISVIDTSKIAENWSRSPGLHRFIYVGVALLLVLAAGWFLVDKNGESTKEQSLSLNTGNMVLRERPVEAANKYETLPDTSITILPFEGEVEVLNSLSYEVGDILREVEDIYITSINQTQEYSGNTERLKVDSRFLLVGEVESDTTATGELLSGGQSIHLRLTDKRNESTVWQETISVAADELANSAWLVADSVARHFNMEISKTQKQKTLPTDIYLKYLTAKAEARKPLTQDSMTTTRDLFESIVEIAPHFGEARAGLCETYINLYRETRTPVEFEKAERHCHRAQTLGADNSYVQSVMGRLYSIAGNYESAEQHFDRALKLAPYSTDTMRGLARNYEKQSMFQEAEEVLLSTIAIEPNYWTNYQSLASIYFSTGDYDKAAQFFSSQSELVLQKAKALNNVGAAYFLLEDFGLAIDSWEESLLEDPTPETYTNLGSAYFFNHQYTRALTSYQSAVRLSPDDHRLWGNLGEALLFSNGDYVSAYRSAIELNKAQLAINPNDVELLASIATYYAALDEGEESLKHLDKALSFSNDDVYVVYDAAVTYSRLGNKEEAGKLIAQLVSMGYSETLISRDANFK